MPMIPLQPPNIASPSDDDSAFPAVAAFLRQPLTIGALTIPNRLLLAPVDGVFDRAARGLYAGFGPGMTFSEILSARMLRHAAASTIRKAQPADEEGCYAVQLAGHEPEILAAAVRNMIAHGVRFDAVDLNMGCPSKNIVTSGSGSALMRDPLLARDCVAALVESAAPRPVTVKMRSRFDAESPPAAVLAAAAVEAGAALITVHGRRRDQFFSGPVDFAAIAAVARSVSAPVVGNGGVHGLEDALRMIEETGCAALMVASGCFGNPWLLRTLLAGESRPVGLDEWLALVSEHLRRAVAERGEERGIPPLRKHLAWYVRGLHQSAALRQELMTCKTADGLLRLLDDYRLRLVQRGVTQLPTR